MRILVASQPKTGNVWIRNLLASIYELEDLNATLKENTPADGHQFKKFVSDGKFREHSIFHQHFMPNKERVLVPVKSIDAHVVTMLRNPYDAFVSFFFYVNNFPDMFSDKPPGVLVGKNIDDEDVIEFINDRYRNHLMISCQWVKSGESFLVRYEDLKERPLNTLRELCEKIKPVEEAKINRAIESNSVDNMRKKADWLDKHIRAAKVENWRLYLNSRHLGALRKYSDLIRSAGYEVY